MSQSPQLAQRQSPQGLLLVNKPSGITSHDVVAKVRKILSTKSVGHTGTLDPMASGLMILLLGEATKLSQYILEGNKSYRVGLRLGFKTDTLDSTGTVVQEKPVKSSVEQVKKAALEFFGEFNWPVPIYSAVKVQGQKLYDYAREGAPVEIPTKLMKFWDVKVAIEASDALGEFQFELTCSKGSYIRSWVDQLGDRLECGAMMTSLVRTWSDPYFVAQALSLEEIEFQWKSHGHISSMIELERALPNVKRVKIKGMDQKLLVNGTISHDLRVQLIQAFQPGLDNIIQVFSQDTGLLLALLGLDPERGFVIRRVLNLQ
jgi:tRNA pseudouridine55 synthase